MLKKRIAVFTALAILVAAVSGCSLSSVVQDLESELTISSKSSQSSTVISSSSQENTDDSVSSSSGKTFSGGNISTAQVTSDGVIDATDMFTERDLTQEPDLTDATYYTVTSNDNISITADGIYVISGTSQNTVITVNAGDEDKVQIVLDGVNIQNENSPAIYVINADKVFITTTSSENYLSVTGTFTADGDTNTDAVIFSKDDIVLNGTGTLEISSSDNGITCKDDLKITGGTINITCKSDALEANDSIEISDGNITIVSDKDGMHAENDEDNSVGYIYICGGTFDITAADDAIHATTIIQIDGGTFTLKAGECIEGTYIQINDGTIDISASDDGINAANKSSYVTTVFEMNGGYVTIVMGAGDTDAVDSNGNLFVNGGTLDITAQSPFDCDGQAKYNGGTIIVNGVETNAITTQMMGGMMGGMTGGRPGGMFG